MENAAKTSFPLVVLEQGFVEFVFVKIRPIGGRCVIFCIGRLPDQKITQAPLAAGADDQIRVRQIRSVEIFAE